MLLKKNLFVLLSFIFAHNVFACQAPVPKLNLDKAKETCYESVSASSSINQEQKKAESPFRATTPTEDQADNLPALGSSPVTFNLSAIQGGAKPAGKRTDKELKTHRDSNARRATITQAQLNAAFAKLALVAHEAQ